MEERSKFTFLLHSIDLQPPPSLTFKTTKGWVLERHAIRLWDIVAINCIGTRAWHYRPIDRIGLTLDDLYHRIIDCSATRFPSPGIMSPHPRQTADLIVSGAAYNSAEVSWRMLQPRLTGQKESRDMVQKYQTTYGRNIQGTGEC